MISRDVGMHEDAFMHVACEEHVPLRAYRGLWVRLALPIFGDVIAAGGGDCSHVKSSACSHHRNMEIFAP